MLVFNFLILALADTSVRFTLKSPTSKRALYEISSSSFGLIVNLPTTSDSFSLRPEDHQPSGTCNFSRIDTARLITGANLASGDNIYAVNYNILRIMSGMGGVAYSN